MFLTAIYRLGPAPLTIFMLAGSATLFLGGFERHRWYIAPVVLTAAVAIRWHIMLIDTEQDRLFRYIVYAALNVCALTLIVPLFVAGITG